MNVKSFIQELINNKRLEIQQAQESAQGNIWELMQEELNLHKELNKLDRAHNIEEALAFSVNGSDDLALYSVRSLQDMRKYGMYVLVTYDTMINLSMSNPCHHEVVSLATQLINMSKLAYPVHAFMLRDAQELLAINN